ncbi:hypothetical protein HMPREF0083_01536 [Aneurinibacillus aneurinilyticus ATCC 12856]|uniref:Uncharacterized protein n=1 Tax=Aneurinibacillus aneurinilyticus ATCC 12856 TaxID=649747 RepID=U1WP51_ANEAE|nr:hypothetical protein HMPREF0083_01536 [Aneurinibacillus aneurinilyticus ATCC 12856]
MCIFPNKISRNITLCRNFYNRAKRFASSISAIFPQGITVPK